MLAEKGVLLIDLQHYLGKEHQSVAERYIPEKKKPFSAGERVCMSTKAEA